MIKSSKTALIAALFAGVAGIAAQPAVAKDKQQAAAPANGQPQLKLSDDFRKAAAPAQDALAKGDLATAATQVAAAEAAAKTDDEKYVAAKLRLSLVAKQQQAAGSTGGSASNDAALASPLETLVNSPVTPAEERGHFAYLRGSIAYEQKDYKTALTYFQKAQAAGYQDPNMPLQIAQAEVNSGDVQGGIAQLDQVVKAQEASGQKPSEDLYRYAIAHLYKTNDRAATLDWVRRWLTAYPTAKNWRDAIVVFGFEGPTAAQLGRTQKVDLYRLMRATGSLADQGDYLQYANDVTQLGLPDEAVTVLNQGKASGKLSGDATTNSLLAAAKKSAAQEGSLSGLATKAKAASSGDLASQTADAYLGQDNYQTAIDLYQVALQKGVKDANTVNLHLGIAQALAGDKTAAEAQFAKVQPGPDKDVAILWNTWAQTGTTGGTTAGAGATASGS
jgi:hypothetical protein